MAESYLFLPNVGVNDNLETKFNNGSLICYNTDYFSGSCNQGIVKCGVYSTGNSMFVFASKTSGANVYLVRKNNNSYSLSFTGTLSSYNADYDLYYFGTQYALTDRTWNIRLYGTFNDVMAAFNDGQWDIKHPITYRLTNCTAPSAPAEAAVGDTVNVPLVMQQGYDIVTPSTDIVVTNNGVAVPHTYSNGTISFTMPDPS